MATGPAAVIGAKIRIRHLRFEGMGQRLGIASALLGDPATLILDEPANGLDPEGILWIRNLLKGLAAEGRTVFLSSHVLSEVERNCTRVGIIRTGELVRVEHELQTGRRGAARARLTRLETWGFGGIETRYWRGACAEAEGHFAAAQELNARIGAPTWTAQTRQAAALHAGTG